MWGVLGEAPAWVSALGTELQNSQLCKVRLGRARHSLVPLDSRSSVPGVPSSPSLSQWEDCGASCQGTPQSLQDQPRVLSLGVGGASPSAFTFLLSAATLGATLLCPESV